MAITSAHKAAHPDKHHVKDEARKLYPLLEGIESRFGPTKVHLQVWDGEQNHSTRVMIGLNAVLRCRAYTTYSVLVHNAREVLLSSYRDILQVCHWGVASTILFVSVRRSHINHRVPLGVAEPVRRISAHRACTRKFFYVDATQSLVVHAR